MYFVEIPLTRSPKFCIVLQFFALHIAQSSISGILAETTGFVEHWDVPSFDYALCKRNYLVERPSHMTNCVLS
jgi:hypothetical protein